MAWDEPVPKGWTASSWHLWHDDKTHHRWTVKDGIWDDPITDREDSYFIARSSQGYYHLYSIEHNSTHLGKFPDLHTALVTHRLIAGGTHGHEPST